MARAHEPPALFARNIKALHPGTILALPGLVSHATTWLGNLRIRLVGGSLLARTVVTVAAFTMTTCLLLGLFSMVAVGATRAIVGGGAPPEATVAEADAAAEGADPAKASARKASKARASKSSTKGRGPMGSPMGDATRPGGAVAPADALRAAADDEEGGS